MSPISSVSLGAALSTTDVDEDDGLVQLDLTVKNAADETRVFGTANVRLPLAASD